MGHIFTTEKQNSFTLSNFSKTILLGLMLLGGASVWGQTYTWIGGSSGVWSTGTNWSTGSAPSTNNHDVVFSSGGPITVTGVTSAAVKSLSITNNTNLTLQAATTNTLSISGTVSGNTNFLIEAGSTLSNTATNILSITIGATANPVLPDISGTLNWNGGTISFPNGTTCVSTISSTGIINHSAGTITMGGTPISTRIVFASGATYNYLGTSTALTVPLATWNDGSQVNITGVTSGIPAGLTQNFGNVLWDCPSQSGTINLATFPSGITGIFEVRNTNNQLLSNTLTGARTWTGDLLVSGGRFAVRGGTANAATSLTVRDCTIDNTLSANAQLIVDISTGTTVVTVGLTTTRDFKIILTQNSNYANLVQYRGVSMTENITVGGNFTQTGNFTGQIRENAATSGTQNFIFQNGTNSVYSADRADIFGPITTINITSATVDFGNSILTYTGNFALTNATAHAKFGGSGYLNNTGTFSANVAGNTLTIGSQDGITTTGGLTGNIRSSAGRTYNAGTNLIYVGSTGQITGNAQPAASTGYIMVNLSDAGALTFTNPTLSGNGVNVRMVSGSLANAITYTHTTNSILTYEGVAAQTTTDNEFPVTNGPRSLVINNPNGVTLHAPRSTNSNAANFLTLTSGVLNTTTTNVLTVLNTAVGGVVGGDATSYVNGPLIRAINAAGTYNFPVGDGATYGGYSMATVAPASGVNLRVQYENSASGGTAGLGLTSIDNYHWLVERTAGTNPVTYTPTLTIGGLTASSRVGYSKTLTGAYDNTGAVNIGASITSGQQQTINTTDPNAYYAVGTTGTLSGTQTAYTTLTSIANALQTMQVTGNTVFELPTTYSGEVVPNQTVTFTQFSEDGGGPYNVTIRPATGSTNFLTAGVPGSTNSLINLNGIDRLTIDGRAGGSGSSVWTFRNTQTAATVGPTFQLINDATYNTLTYLTVEGQNIQSASGTIVFGAASSLGNSNNTISHCDIRENTATGTTPANGIYSVGTTNFSNANNTITNNNIYNNFVAGVTGAGVWVGTNNIAWTISNNHFYQTASRTSTGAVVRYGIYVASTIVGSDNYTISGNYIGGSEANAGGSPYTISAGAVAQAFRGIDVSFHTSATNCVISNNVIRNITIGHGSTTATIIFAGIYSSNGTQQVFDNTIGSTNGSNTINVSSVGTGANNIYGIFIAAGVDSVYNNTIAGIRLPNTNGLSSITGVHLQTTGNAFVNNNIIGDFISGYTGTGAALIRGINTNATGINTITNNTIYELSSAANNAGTLANAIVIGILDASTVSSSTDSQIISGNTIHSLSNIHGTAAANIIGIYLANPTSLTNRIAQCDRNFIHSLSLSTSSATASITGVHLASGVGYFYNNMIRLGIDASGSSITSGYLIYGINNASATTVNTTVHNKFYHNSVYLGGTGVNGANKTFAFYRSVAGLQQLDVRNNILMNVRSNSVSGTGLHYAVGFVGNYTTTLNIDNNLYNYSGTGGAMAEMPTSTAFSTVIDWQSSTGKDLSSLSGIAGFINPTGNAAAVNLHINPALPTQVESAGVAIDGFDLDYDSDFRFHNPSYIGSGTAPDMGADEGEFTPQDATAPLIVYQPLTGIPTQTSFTAPTLVAAITDANAVNVASGFAPRIYYRRSTDANTYNDNTSGTDGWKYVEQTTPVGNNFSLQPNYALLNGGTGVSAGMTIQYFVVAQDTSSNVAINSGTFAAAPSSVQLTSAAFPLGGTINSYYINVLNGTYTVGTGGNFTSLTNAGGLFETINTGSLSGNVIAEITTDLTAELGTHALNQWIEIGGSGYTLTIRPSAAATRTISGNLNGDLFRLDGADRVTIDGRFGGSGQYLVFANTSALGGASTLTFLNEATNNTIQYSFLRGSSTATTKGTILFSTSAAVGSLGNSDNVIEYCDIHDNASALPRIGIYSAGTAAKLNVNNTIRNNNIYNFFNAGGGSAGVMLAGNTSAWTIENNKFYQEATRTTTGASTFHYVIRVDNTSNASTIIRGNYVGGNSSVGTGTMTYTAGVGNQFGAIYLNTSSTTSTPTIVENNTITNFSFTGASGATSGVGPFTAIYQAAGASRIKGNTIGAATGNGAISVTVSAGGGISNAIRYDGASTVKIEENTIGSITVNGVTAGNNGQNFYAINLTTGNAAIKNNLIGSASTGSSIQITGNATTNPSVLGGINIVSTSAHTDSVLFNTIYNLTNVNGGTGTRIFGISATSAAQYFIDDNTIRNLSLTASTNVGTANTPAVLGIALVTSNTQALSLSRNKVYALTNAGSGASAWTTGIHYNGGTSSLGTNVVDGNFVHSLSPSAGATATVCGIQLAGGTTTNVRNNMIRLGIDAAGASITQTHNLYGIQQTANTVHNIYHNSVYIGGTGVGGALNSFAYQRSQTLLTTAVNLRNNIFVNNRSNGAGTGTHYAVNFGPSAAPTTWTSDNNVFYTNSTGGSLGLIGSTSYATLAAWKTGTTRDAASFYADPQFSNATGNATAVDLHINPTAATPVEATGSDMGVVNDYDGQTRSGLTPIDIGADAGNFVPMDLIPPAISYTPISGVCNSATTYNLSNVVITDDSGVNVTTGTKPRLYYKNDYSSNDSESWVFVESNGTTSPFDFTIDFAGVSSHNSGDIIQYFIVAQDEGPNVYTPNVAINSGSFAGTTTSVVLENPSFPIGGTINAFTILPCSGNVTVGTGGQFPSLTNDGGLFQALNAATLSGNITATVISDLSENGTHALNEWAESGAGNYTVSITPDANTTRVIVGSYVGANAALAGLIRMNGADRVVFDGRNPSDLGANGRHLLFRNTNTASSLNNATIYVFNDADSLTFRNLIIEGATAQTSNGVFRIDADGAGDGNDYITITENQIRDRSDAAGIPANGLYIVGAFNEVNNNITISNNEIFNYHATAGQHAAINVGSYNSDFTITGNSIFDPVTRTTSSSKVGILVDATTGGFNINVSNNYIGGSAGGATGTWTVNTTADYRFWGIYMSTALSSNSVVSNNTIRNFNITTGSIFTTQGSLFTGIYGESGEFSIVNNIIGGASGNIALVSTNTSAFGFVHGIFHSGNGAVTITANTIGGFNISNSSSSAGIRSLIGIRATTSSSDLVEVSDNTIGGSSSAMTNATGNAYNTTNAVINAGIYVLGAQPTQINNNDISYFSYSANGQSTTNAFQVAGIYRASAIAVNTITGNTVNHISSQSPYTGSVASVGLSGIYCVTTSNDQLVSLNTVHTIRNTNSGTGAPAVYGIYSGSGTSTTNNVSRNTIHSLQSFTTGASDIAGIYLGAGGVTVSNNIIRLGIDSTGTSITTASIFQGIVKNNTSINNNIYYNSVYIGGSNVGSTANNTYAFRRILTGANDNVRNNIFVNARSNTSTGGKHYGVFLNNATTLTMNYNLIYTSGTGGVFGGVNTTDYGNLALWLGGTVFDDNSISADPNFTAPTSATPDLHLNIAGGSPAESAGVVISGVEDDYDATGVRTGYPQPSVNGGGTAPDLGADETDVIPMDVTAPIVTIPTAIPTQTTACGTTLNITVSATVTDSQSAVASGSLAPTLWWRLSTGTYAALLPSSVAGSTYTYSLAITGAAPGQTYHYYVAAQDAAGNVGYSHQDASSPIHTDVATAPSTLNGAPATFAVSNITPLSGTVTVGTGGTYTSLTQFDGLFSAINANGLTGNLRVEVISNTTENGNTGLNNWAEYCGSNYRVTIVPSSASVKTLSGSLTGMGLIPIYAARVTIDGSFGGSGRYLKFENTYASSGGSENNTFRFGSGTALASSDTLRYCDVVGNTTKTAGAVVYMHNISGLVLEENLIHGGTNWAMNIIRADGSSSITIRNNEIYNFLGWSGGVGTRSYGILAPSGNGSNWNIVGNSIYNTGINGQNVQTALSFNPGSSSTNNNIRKNWIGGSSAQCGTGGGVTYWGQNTSPSSTEVQIKAIETNCGAVLLDSNNIANIRVLGSDYSSFIGMHILGSTAATVTNNVFGDGTDGTPSGAKQIQVAGGGLVGGFAPGYLYGIWNVSSSAASTVYDKNDFYDLQQYGAYVGGQTFAIWHGSAGPAEITNNRINGLSSAGIEYNSFAIRLEPSTSTSGNIITGNTIKTPRIGAAYINQAASIGIYVNILGSRTVSGTISNNRINDAVNLENSGYIEGIYLNTWNGNSSSNGNWNIHNNMIYLSNPGETTIRTEIDGIDIQLNSSSTANVYYNTVWIDGFNRDNTSTLANPSAAFLNMPGPSGGYGTINLRNNMFINTRQGGSPNSDSYHVAIWRSTASATGLTSDNNMFLYRTGHTYGRLAIWGLNAMYNLSTWQGFTGTDANTVHADWTSGASSFSGNDLNPADLFTQALGSSDLHIDLTDGQSYQFISDEGTSVSVTSDFDGDARNGSTPDIGADEFDACAGPVVTTQPSNQSICEGANVQFVVANSGLAPFTYTWQVNTGSGWNDITPGAPYSGINNDTLTITAATAAMNGYQYRVNIENACGEVDSDVATLTINEAPEITAYSPPGMVNSVCALSNTGFGVTATNATGYVWQVSTNGGGAWATVTNVAPYSGATTATLAINNTPANLHGNLYRVIVSGTCSPADTSSNMTLNVGAVSIITQPLATTTICDGANGIIFVEATGNNLSYQWEVNTGSGWNSVTNGGVYSGATNDTLSITGAIATMNGYQYRVIINTIACTALTSTTSTLNVPASPTASISGSTTVCLGDATTITFNGTANATVTYTINGGSNQTIVLNGSGAATLNTGALSVETTYALVSVLSGSCSSSATGSAVVSINPTANVNISATSTTLCAGNGTQVQFTDGPAFAELAYTINGGSPLYIMLNGSGAATVNTGVLFASRTYALVSVADEFCETELTGSVTVTVAQEPEAFAGNDVNVSCAATSVNLSGATADNAVTILWTTSGDGTFNNAGIANPTYTFGAGDDVSVTLTLTVTGGTGCGSANDAVTINIAQATWYADTDGDGFGDPSSTPNCTGGVGYAQNNTDFCDTNAQLNPATGWFVDFDNDGYGSYVQTTGDIGAGCNTSFNMPGVGNLVLVGNDCNDGNANVHPGATEICWNGIDDNCDGQQNEGCAAIPPPANDNPASNNPNLSSVNNVYPNCNSIQGTTTGATVNAATGTRDVWYQFTAISNGVSIRVSSTQIDPAIYLYNATASAQLAVESVVTGTGTEILNFGGLVEGQSYRIAVSSTNASDGTFSICAMQLRKPTCGTAGPYSLCTAFKSSNTGAATTTYSFTLGATTTSTTTAGSVTLGQSSLQLQYGNTYDVGLIANYVLADGNGLSETVNVPNAAACSIALTDHPFLEVRSNQRCNTGALLYRTSYLLATPIGSALCGATGYRVEFTPVSNCAGANPQNGQTFSKTITSASASISLSYAFNHLTPAGSYPATGYWLVRWKPRFGSAEGEYGPAHVIAVAATAPASGMALAPEQEMNGLVNTNSIEANLYPNPNNGEMVNLNMTGITTPDVYVRIMDAMGRVVYSNRYTVEGSLNTSVNFTKPLAGGLYMVEFTTGNEVVTQRMLVAR